MSGGGDFIQPREADSLRGSSSGGGGSVVVSLGAKMAEGEWRGWVWEGAGVAAQR